MSLTRSLYLLKNIRMLSSATAAITRVHRTKYLRMYPTKIINPDGSSITARYREPRQIIKLPLDISTLSEAEMKARLDRRRPKTKLKIQEEEITKFDAKKYIGLLRKK